MNSDLEGASSTNEGATWAAIALGADQTAPLPSHYHWSLWDIKRNLVPNPNYLPSLNWQKR